MIDVEKIRKDFSILSNNTKMQGKDLIYFDSAATSLKPDCVIEKMTEYYKNYNSNVSRGDYDLAYTTDVEFNKTRESVARFINANKEEIVFTSGTTNSLNLIAFGYCFNNLNEGDEIILNEAEHASNILPWVEIAKLKKLVIKYASIDENGKVMIDSIKELINSKTKLISIAHVNNTYGAVNDIKDITTLAHKNNIIVVVDGAQSTPHKKIDVKDLDADFFVFSSHKMCGPTGLGIMYGKYALLEKMLSLKYGGSMNIKFSKDSTLYRKPPYYFEGGTPAIAEVIGFNKTIEYLESIGMDNIEEYEKELKEYAMEKLSKLDNITVYSKNNKTGLITFNIKGVFCQDAGSFFNYHGIAVRTGHHCAKLLNFNEVGTVRASLYFYNTKEEIDKFVEVCKEGGNFLDAIFK